MQYPNWKRGFVGADCWRLWGELMIGLIPGTPKSITNSALEFEDIEELLKNFQQQAKTVEWILAIGFGIPSLMMPMTLVSIFWPVEATLEVACLPLLPPCSLAAEAEIAPRVRLRVRRCACESSAVAPEVAT